MLATPGSKIRLQGFSRCADGDRARATRTIPNRSRTAAARDRTSCFRHTPVASAAVGSVPRCYGFAVRRHGSRYPRGLRAFAAFTLGCLGAPSHSRERPEIVWALFLPRTTRVRILLSGPIPKTSDSARDEMSLRRQIRIAEPVSEHRERYPCGSKHQRQLLVILTAETCCQRERHWTWRIY